MTTPPVVKTPKQNEEEEIIKELCVCNGLTFNRLAQEGLSCVRLEMFFSGYPKIVGLKNFPNLQVLCLIGQPIQKFQGLSAVPKLKELWIAECQIQKIEGLSELKQLKRLYLYDNMIQRIENLSHMKELEKLWINNNLIEELDGLNHLKFLRDVNLAENQISKIGNAFNGLVHLEKLELSGNQIASFKDLTNLNKLPGLRELGLNSPQYKPNPVSLLCNYTTHLLYHLPFLAKIDTYDVSNKAIKDLAETTVLKKKMFYNMKAKILQRELSNMQKVLLQTREEYQQPIVDRYRTLSLTIKQVDRELLEQQSGEDETMRDNDSGTESDKDAREQQAAQQKSITHALKCKHKAIKDRMKKWDQKLLETDHYLSEACARLRAATDLRVRWLTTELETGGNVRFEDGKPADVWFTSCHDLVLSRFCASSYKDHGVQGIRIHRITRVHNRILQSRFNEKLSAAVETDDSHMPGAKSANYRRSVEYLFWAWDPELPAGQSEPSRVLDEGFMDAATHQTLGREAGVPLTNSMNLADKARISHLSRHSKGRDYADTTPFRYGQLVISKAYLGKCVTAADRYICSENYHKADSVMKPTSQSSDNKSTASPNKTCCECSSRQCEWFVFDNHLVIPEYVVDFEYITKMKSRSPFTSYSLSYAQSRDVPSPPTMAELPGDEDVLLMEPQVAARPRLVSLTEDMLLSFTKASSHMDITVLNLHNNGLTRLKCLTSLPLLKRLIISFNEFSRLDDISQLNLEYLDASFNKITTLEGIKGLNKLKHLDLSWNQLSNTRDDISILRKHCPAIKVLDLRHNRWQKPEGLRLRAIGRIKSLTKLDGSAITEIEAAQALRQAAGSRISQVSLLAHSRTDAAQPRSLGLAFYAQILALSSRNKPDRGGEQDNLWYSKVTVLNLDNQHISKLSNLERLDNLKWASFCNNDITKIEGLDGCTNLEELGLDDNCISRLEGIHNLTKLSRLSMDRNYLSTLESSGLDRITSLTYLSLEGNRLASLGGLQRMAGLAELYVGNNNIQNIREIFYLKNLSSLYILDLCGNPVAQSADNYRLFVIYHLKSLKALDGTAIESLEGGMAKDAFGGRLTQDFVAERMGHSNFNEVRELDLPQCGIRTVDLGMGDLFVNLRSVNLEHNNMTSFSGLIFLVNLRVLCLNHNHIECIVARPRKEQSSNNNNNSTSGKGKGGSYSSVFNNPENYTPILESLEVLHLGYNGIKDLVPLQLGRLTSLKALFLQGNEISSIDGLGGLHDLRELVLDRNKIKAVGEFSFVNQWNLQELHIEENRIKELNNLTCLENLQRLFLGINRIQELTELEKLESLTHLAELSVVNNVVARRMLHRPMLVFRMQSLVVIDGIPVSDEERAKAELYFMDQQPVQMTNTIEATLPGIGQYKTHIPVKVTNVQLGSGPYYDKQWSGPVHLSDEALQQEVQRVLSKQNLTNAPSGAGRRRGQGGHSDALQGINPAKSLGTLTFQQHAAANSSTAAGGGGSNGAKHQHGHQMSQVPYVPHQNQGDIYGRSQRR